jgi:HEPN domain-containing protein
MKNLSPSTKHQLRINDFARRAFRDIADMDYIAARQSARAGLIPQFLWSALQAFEKYLKYVLLVNRVSSKGLGHDIVKGLARVREHVSYIADLRPDKFEVFRQVAEYGQDRYLIGSYSAHGPLLPELDAAVWDLRRYCQLLAQPTDITSAEYRAFQLTLEYFETSRTSPHRFKISGGILEQIVSSRDHTAHNALCWQNAFFGKRTRKIVQAKSYMQSANAPLWLYPDMIDDLDQLVQIPKPMADAYRQYRDDILAGRQPRP